MNQFAEQQQKPVRVTRNRLMQEYEFALPTHGMFTLSSKELVDSFFKAKGLEYYIVETKRSRGLV